MWYLAWILGIMSASSLAIISVIKYEFRSEKNKPSAN
ncbi:cytochrome bd-I oxidase subunit CydX [Endozoicomonas numazuensis]